MKLETFVLICVHLCLSVAQKPLPGAEPPRIEAVVYYSKEDPHWTDAERVLDTVARQYAPLGISKVCIDDEAGYRQLAEAEQRLHVTQTGDLTVVLTATCAAPADEPGTKANSKASTEQLALTSSCERRDVEKCLATVVKRLRKPAEGKGRVEADVPVFAVEVFGKAGRVEALADVKAEHFRYYAVYYDAERAGWMVDAFRHINCPVCNDMQFLMAVSSPDLKVLRIRPQRDLERLATTLDNNESEAFLNQFKGRGPETSRMKVDAISGATKTCRLYESAVRDALAEIQKREKK